MKCLFVDDDANLLSAIHRGLSRQFNIDVALGPDVGLSMLRNTRYAIVVADMRMPGMTGIDFLKRARVISPDTVRLMLTGDGDQKTAIAAVNDGNVFRFLSKPCPATKLVPALEAASLQHRHLIAERELLEKTLRGSIKALVDVLSVVAPTAFGHCRRIQEYMQMYLKSQESPQTWELEVSAMLSQLGQVTLPRSIIDSQFAGKELNSSEAALLERVPQFGADLIANIPRLENVAAIVRYQLKNFDGSGSPADSVSGEEIPLGARILRVLNQLVLSEDRTISMSVAFATMHGESGKYDPSVLRSVAACFDLCCEAPQISPPISICPNDLRVGQRLVENVFTTDGTLVAMSGTDVSPAVLRVISNLTAISRIEQRVLVAAA